MNNELLLLLVGAVLPPVADLINKHIKDSNMRFLIVVGLSFLIGAVIAFFQYGWDGLLANAGLIFATSQAVYKLWYEDSGLQARVRG